MPQYSSYKVGYVLGGEKAGVTLEFEKAVVTESSRPKDKYHRETFPVVTTGKSVDREGLASEIQKAFADPQSTDLKMLLKAHENLNRFISKNGSTNWKSSLDWGEDIAHGPDAAVGRTFEMA
jgi:hypothetical protein